MSEAGTRAEGSPRAAGHNDCYWPRTQSQAVGLKQTLSEQRALVSERPHVFEEQFTSGGFGWVVVVHLAGIELSELVFEAWRLSAPPDLVAEVPKSARPDLRPHDR